MPDPTKINDPKTIAYEEALRRNKNALDNVFTSLNTDLSEKSANPYAAAAPASFNPLSTDNTNKNFERYYSHSSYDKLGFNPWKDNETLYNQQGSKWGDVWRATKSAGKLAVTGFLSPIRSYADLTSGDALNADYQSAQEMKYLNAVGSSSRGGVTGFASNLITNSGYTVGLIGEMALETAALTAAVGATGGVAAPSWIGRMGKFGKDLGKYAETLDGITKSTQALNNFSTAKTFWQGVKGVANFVNPLSNTAEAVNLAKNAEGLNTLAKVSTTAGGFYRDVQMANLTLSESKLEGASAEKDLEEDLIRDYRAQNDGKQPSQQDLLAIKEKAADAGTKTLAWNIPIIYLTNKITFEPLLGAFTKPSEYTLKNGIKVLEKDGELIESTFKSRLLNSLKPKNLIKAPLTYFKENTSEGIQESAQEIISGTAKDYYKALYNSQAKQGFDFSQAENKSDGVWDALSKNVADQFSGKGFETFASGFLMGGLLKPVGAIIQAATGYQSKEYKKQRSEYAQATLAKLNEINKNPLTFFGSGIINFTNGSEAVTGQNAATEEGNQKDWHDFEDQNLTSNVMTALDSGTYEIFQDKLRSIKTMEPDAIREAYGLDGTEVLSKINRILERADRVKNNYEKWNERYKNPFDIKQFKAGTPEYNRTAIGYATWEHAKKLAIFNETSLQRNTDRIQDITNNILQTPELLKLGANDITLLFNPSTIYTELKLLDNEIEVLQDSEIPGDRSILKIRRDKQRKLENLQNKLRGYYLSQIKGVELGKVNKRQLKKAYVDYVTHLATSQTQSVNVDALNLDNSFDQLLDLHNISQENIHYTEAVNIMANPEGFVDQYKRLNKVFSDLYESREELNKKAIENTQSKMEDNAILNVLFERGFVLSPENVEKLLKNKEIPNEFYDQNAKQVVNESDPIRFQEFKDIITNYVEITKPEPIEEIPVVSTETLEVTAPVEVTPEAARLKIDIDEKFNAITNEEQLRNLEKEMAQLMVEINVNDYNGLGITAKQIEERIKNKLQDLMSNVTLDNLKVGNIVLLNDGNKKAIITVKGKNFVKIKDLQNPGIIVTVKEDNLKNTIKLKYSENMKTEKINPTPEEIAKAKQNSDKVLKLTYNSDTLKAILDEAFADEKKFEQDFMNKLGCK